VLNATCLYVVVALLTTAEDERQWITE